MKAARQDGLLTDALFVDQAIVFWRFAKDDQARDWLGLGHEALTQVHDRSAGSFYFPQASALLSGIALSEQEKGSLNKLLQSWPHDWWLNTLLSGHGMMNERARHAADERAEAAWTRWILGESLHWALIILTLLLAWPAIQLLRGPWSEDKRSHRLLKLWPLALALFAYSLWSLIAFVAGRWLPEVAAHALAQLSSDPMIVYHAQTLAWLVLSITILLFVPWAMGITLAHGWGGVGALFGIQISAFLNWRVWIISIPITGVMLLGLSSLNIFLIDAGWSGGLLDSLSRQASSDDVLMALGWLCIGAIVAPLVEEVIFRGYLFAAIQSWAGATWAVLLSSVLFALSHAYSIQGTVNVLIYGVALALLRLRTKSLVTGSLMHVLNNLISLGLTELQGL